MKHSYKDLIQQNFQFPQNKFELKNQSLSFHNIPLKSLIDKYGTPLRITYLPDIGEKIEQARNWFNDAIKQQQYSGSYQYCYCTKCNHYHHILKTALKHNVNLETSSSFDIDIILSLLQQKSLDENITIIHNGYKTDDYLKKILSLQNYGFSNSIIILDSINELKRLKKWAGNKKIKVGLRMAIEEESKSSYHTSRLGIRHNQLLDFYKTELKGNSQFILKMIHFFVDSGISDNVYYWGEFQKALDLYTQIKKMSPSLDAFNIGGGFPIQNQLKFDYKYENIIHKIVSKIKQSCETEGISEPDIFTEFGKYTVGESSAIIFEVLEQKQQNDAENWYIIDNSLLNTIPDAWYLHEKFILLPINKWDSEYQKVNIGGISCDQSDYYNSEDFNQEILLPKYSSEDKSPLYLGFFHTGAYQDAVSGYGGIKHCLIPSPKQIVIDIDENGRLVDYTNREEQKTSEVFATLGYSNK